MVFLPTDPVYGAWNLVLEIFNLNNFMYYPYYTTFGFPKKIFSSVNFLLLIVSEIFHFLNILVSFFKAYKVSGNEKFITKFEKVWKNYFHGQFLIDFVVFLPLGLLGNIHPDLSPL